MTQTQLTGAGKKRRTRNQWEQPIEYLPTATEFSDDNDLVDPLWLINSIKTELTTPDGDGIWDEIRDATTIKKKEGRPRKPGDWALLYAAYVAAKEPEMVGYWTPSEREAHWHAAGFDERLAFQTMYLRFTELEADRCVEAFEAGADKLIQIAKKHEPRIGREVHYDASAFHTRAVLHHDCPDKATCKAAGGSPKQTIDRASDELVKERRDLEHEQPPVEGELAPNALEDATDQTGRYPRYKMLGGHRYGYYDTDAEVRAYTRGGKTKKAWLGGLAQYGVDGFTGGIVATHIFGAGHQEFNEYFTAAEKVERALGCHPELMTGDRGISIEKVFEWNTRHGIASVIPFRMPNQHVERQDLRCEEVDEHGVARCEFCGGPCAQEGPRLGLSFTKAGEPRIRVRCASPNTPDCLLKVQTKDPAKINYGFRLLLPLSRMSARYHAAATTHDTFERVFRHSRQRYRAIGNDETGKLKRFGLQVHRLRCAVSRFLEWLRICLRHGWIGNHGRINTRDARARRGDKRLRSMLLSRRERGLNLPYGPAAWAIGLALDPSVPPPLIRDKAGGKTKAKKGQGKT
jgi:hypothetical protein